MSMRLVALTIAAIALAVGAFQFAGTSDRASAGVDIVRGDLCGIEAEAQPTGGDDLTIFEPYIDASEGDLFGGFIQVVIIPNGPGGASERSLPVRSGRTGETCRNAKTSGLYVVYLWRTRFPRYPWAGCVDTNWHSQRELPLGHFASTSTCTVEEAWH